MRKYGLILVFLLLVVIVAGCVKNTEGEKEMIADETVRIAPLQGISFNLYYYRYSATDLTISSDIPLDIDSDYSRLSASNITTLSRRIQYSGSPENQFTAVLPGDKVRVVNSNPDKTAKVRVTLTGVRLYPHF
jgi:hypothetical protein